MHDTSLFCTTWHDWYLDFSGHVLMWRCRKCPAAAEAKGRTA